MNSDHKSVDYVKTYCIRQFFNIKMAILMGTYLEKLSMVNIYNHDLIQETK